MRKQQTVSYECQIRGRSGKNKAKLIQLLLNHDEVHQSLSQVFLLQNSRKFKNSLRFKQQKSFINGLWKSTWTMLRNSKM